MTDRYEKIRKALEMRPTPGPWDGDDNSVSRLWSNGSVGIREYIALPDSSEDSTPNPANMHFVAACDPDTIRELLSERDRLKEHVAKLEKALEREREELKHDLERYISIASEEATRAEEAEARLAEARRLIRSTHKRAVTHANCEDEFCAICIGGLFICADCGAAEVEAEERICTGGKEHL